MRVPSHGVEMWAEINRKNNVVQRSSRLLICFSLLSFRGPGEEGEKESTLQWSNLLVAECCCMGGGFSGFRPQIRIRHTKRCRKPPGSDSKVSCLGFKWFPQVLFPSPSLAGGMCCCLPTLNTDPIWLIATTLMYYHLSQHVSGWFNLSSTCVLTTVPGTCTKYTEPPRSSCFKLSAMNDFNQVIWCTNAPT